MGNDIRTQIYNNLNLKETEELLEIWLMNDRVVWTGMAFELIQEILHERIGELPLQGEPVFEYTEDDGDEEFAAETDLDDGNSPKYYKPYEILWLEKWLCRAAIASIVASIFASLLELSRSHDIALSFLRGNMKWNLIAWFIAMVVFIFGIALQFIILYFPLKALGSILRILMEMEFNSRGVKTEKVFYK